MKKKIEAIIKKVDSEFTIDDEMEKLKTITKTIESLDGSQRERVFKYLKNRYIHAWPSDSY